jgi:hypothetical protein
MATVNYFATTNAAGSFGLETTGYIQGTLLDNPVELFKIAGGQVATTETLPMWGGIPIIESVPTYPPTSLVSNFALGGSIARATTVSNWTGFTCYNQAQAMLNWPQSPVPTSAPGTSVNLVRKGSNVRLAVAADPVLVSLQGSTITPTNGYSWDFNNQLLQPYDASTATIAVASAAWALGVYTLTVVTANFTGTIAVPVAGDMVNISGATNTGNGGGAAGAALVNGNFLIASVATSGSNTLLNINVGGTSAMYGTIGGSILLNYGVGAMAVTVLGVFPGNSMTAQYNSLTGNTVWNRSGCTAVIIV